MECPLDAWEGLKPVVSNASPRKFFGKPTVEEEEPDCRHDFYDKACPVKVTPPLVMEYCEATHDRPDYNHDIHDRICKHHSNVAIFIGHQLWDRNEGNPADSGADAVETEPRDEHRSRVCAGANDVRHGGYNIGRQEKVPAAEEVRVGPEYEDSHGCGCRDARNDPRRELGMAESPKQLR